MAAGPQAAELLQAFAAGEVGQGCTLHGPAEVPRRAEVRGVKFCFGKAAPQVQGDALLTSWRRPGWRVCT